MKQSRRNRVAFDLWRRHCAFVHKADSAAMLTDPAKWHKRNHPTCPYRGDDR